MPALSTLLATLLLVSVTASAQTPDRVPHLPERRLERADYVELARQWQEYVDTQGATVEALVNLGMAYDYSGQLETAKLLAKRAVELGPEDPAALAFAGKMLAVIDDDEDSALELLERCRRIAPGYLPCLNSLTATQLRRGSIREAMAIAAQMFEQESIDRPLQDFAYNLLVGLPEGAVLITSGDNDTLPTLALQSGMDFRSDVIVVNRSLLNLPDYAEGVFELHPELRPDVDIERHEAEWGGEQATLLSTVLIKAMIEEAKAPIYVAPTAAYENLGYEPNGLIEGLNFRATGSGLSASDAGRLFFEAYRLDSATDWNFPWSLKSNLRTLMRNYVSAMVRNAMTDGIPTELRDSLLEKAHRIAAFHEMTTLMLNVEKMQGHGGTSGR